MLKRLTTITALMVFCCQCAGVSKEYNSPRSCPERCQEVLEALRVVDEVQATGQFGGNELTQETVMRNPLLGPSLAMFVGLLAVFSSPAVCEKDPEIVMNPSRDTGRSICSEMQYELGRIQRAGGILVEEGGADPLTGRPDAIIRPLEYRDVERAAVYLVAVANNACEFSLTSVLRAREICQAFTCVPHSGGLDMSVDLVKWVGVANAIEVYDARPECPNITQVPSDEIQKYIGASANIGSPGDDSPLCSAGPYHLGFLSAVQRLGVYRAREITEAVDALIRYTGIEPTAIERLQDDWVLPSDPDQFKADETPWMERIIAHCDVKF